ncbi:MAG: transposase, partial [Pseudobdellovibrionaceae bacterium]
MSDNYKLLSASVEKIPAKGRLAKFAVKKYGYRRDEREKALRAMLSDLKSRLTSEPKFICTDQSSVYPKLVKEFFPSSI